MTVELALYAPVLIILFALLIAAGRITHTRNAVTAAAASAARAASLARTAADASAAANAAAGRYLAGEGLRCGGKTISTDTSGFSVPPGQAATVQVRVACTLAFSDAALPGLPGSGTYEANGTSPLDTYRARTT